MKRISYKGMEGFLFGNKESKWDFFRVEVGRSSAFLSNEVRSFVSRRLYSNVIFLFISMNSPLESFGISLRIKTLKL